MVETNPHDQFKDHKIRRNAAMSLLLKNPNSGNMWCTIAIDDHGQIVVFGDFGPIVFGHCVAPFEQRIEWLGSHADVDDYVLGKARIGMSGLQSALTVSSAEAFEADVRQEFKVRLEALDDIGDEGRSGRIRAALTWESFQTRIDPDELEMLNCTVLPAQQSLDRYMDDLGYIENWEWIGKTGQRPIPAIFHAHAALRRAHLLLEADKVPFG